MGVLELREPVVSSGWIVWENILHSTVSMMPDKIERVALDPALSCTPNVR